MGFSGLWVVWSRLGVPGEKKKRKPNVFIAPAKKLPPTAEAFFTKKGTFRTLSRFAIQIYFSETDRFSFFRNRPDFN